MKIKVKSRRALVGALAIAMFLPQTLLAERRATIDESPNAGVMVADLVVARPVGVLITAVGTVAFFGQLAFHIVGRQR